MEDSTAEQKMPPPAPALAPGPSPSKPPRPKPPPDKAKLMYEVLNSDERSTLTLTNVLETSQQLINVEYPGIVVNNDRALRTMGGAEALSEVFSNHKKKLEVKYRPGDIYSNPIVGEGSTTCGLLIRIRRPKKQHHHHKSKKKLPEPKLINLESGEPGLFDPIPLTEDERYELFEGQTTSRIDSHVNSNDAALIKTKYNQQDQGVFELGTPNGAAIHTDMILAEEERLIEEYNRNRIRENLVVSKNPPPIPTNWQQNRMEPERDKILLSIPQKSPILSGWNIEVLGIVPKIYKFTGLADFQYLPMTKDEKNPGKHVSIYNKIVPIFGDPEGLTNLYAGANLFVKGQSGEAIEFIVPPFMSRVDKPMISNAKELEGTTSRQTSQQITTTVTSTRAKRIIYSHLCNFRSTDDKFINGIIPDETLVPTDIIPEALTAVKKRQVDYYVVTFQQLFDERPIWTRQAIDYKIKCGKYITKYLLPCVAYFSSNGPWRSCWIRLGYDPRKCRVNFMYQLIDYRLAFQHRIHLPKVSPGDESLFAYRPDFLPPKAQMFYQICELHIKEVQELTSSIMKRIQDEELCADEFQFTPKHGFLDEDTLEYIRYSISRNLEIYLSSKNLIPAVTLPPLNLLPGGIVPKNPGKSMSMSGRAASFTVRLRNRPKFNLGKEQRVVEDDEESNIAAEYRIPTEDLETSEEEEDEDEYRVLDEVFDDEDDEEEEEDEESEPLGEEEMLTPDEVLKEVKKKKP